MCKKKDTLGLYLCHKSIKWESAVAAQYLDKNPAQIFPIFSHLHYWTFDSLLNRHCILIVSIDTHVGSKEIQKLLSKSVRVPYN